MNPKFLILVVAIACSSNLLFARELRFTLKCEVDKPGDLPASVSKYQVVKVAKQDRAGGPWTNSYLLQVFPKTRSQTPREIGFVTAGSGDEDYNEYDLDATDAVKVEVNVSAAYVQNRFAWVSLIDAEGSSFARCD